MTTAMHRWGARAAGDAFMSGLALLLATLSVLAIAATPTAAQSLKRGPVLIETHHTDLAGNIRLSTNEAGDVTQRLDYAPFGEVDGRSCTGDGDPTRSPQFQGKLRDPKTCLDDFGARDYYMVTGRFQSVDPVLPVETALRDPQQWNRYAYARNNPLIYTDPDGREVRGDEECPACPAAIAAAAAPEATAAVTATVVATARVWGPTLVNAAQALALKAAQFFSSPTGQEVIQAGAELVTGAELGPGGVPSAGGIGNKVERAVFWSGRQGANRAAAEAFAQTTGGTTLEMTTAGRALEAAGGTISDWKALSADFAQRASGRVVAFVGGARPTSVWSTIEKPNLMQNPNVTSISIRDAAQPWKTRVIYK